MTVVEPQGPGLPNAQAPTTEERWHARLRLRLADRGGATAIVEHEMAGHLAIDEPHASADGRCHVVIAYPRSGIASGQRSRLRVDVTDGGSAVVTTAGPVRLNRSAGPTSTIERHLTASDSSALEWLPRASIVSAGANAEMRTRVILDEGARFLGWELMGRGGASVVTSRVTGRLHQRLEVRRAGEILVDERVVIDGPHIRTSTGRSEGTAFGTIVAVHPGGVTDQVADRALRIVTAAPQPGSVWHTSGALLVRVPALRPEAAMEMLERLRRVLRPSVLGWPGRSP